MKIAISGAGIAGLTAAIALKKQGFDPIVFEAAASLRPVGAGLGLGPNALRGLESIGLADKVRAAGHQPAYFEIRNQRGSTLSKTIQKELGDSVTIHRAALHRILLSELGQANICTAKKAIDLTKTASGVSLEFEDGSTYEADCLVIAEGIHSALRYKVTHEAVVQYAGYTCWRAVVKNSGIRLDGAVEIRGAKGRFGYVPLADGSIYWFACVNAPQNKRLDHFTLRHLQIIFEGYDQSVATLLSETEPSTLIHGPIEDVKPLPCYAFDNVVLIGDAAHAATPNTGQGACQAIEDAVVLANCLRDNPSARDAFFAFEQQRLKRTHYVIKQSRLIGKMAQLQCSLQIFVRDIALKLIPSWVRRRQLNKINEYEF